MLLEPLLRTLCSEVTDCFDVDHFFINCLLSRTCPAWLSSRSKMLSMSFLSLMLSYESTDALACLPRILLAWLPCNYFKLTILWIDTSLFSSASSGGASTTPGSCFCRTPGKGVRFIVKILFLLLLKLLRLPAICGVATGLWFSSSLCRMRLVFG